MPAERLYGMDHDHYAWSALPTRGPLRWPQDASLAICALVVLEHYDWRAVEGSYALKRPSGGFFSLPFPDYGRHGHREYGHRVGIFRVLDALEAAGIPPTVAVDALTAEHYPWLMSHLVDRGVEFVGHGVAASRLITSHMSESDEIETIERATAAITSATGQIPVGWFGPEAAESARTPALVAAKGYRYLCDWPNDEQPYPMTVPSGDLTALPMFLEADDEVCLWHRRLTPTRYAQLLKEAGNGLANDGSQAGRLFVVTLRPWLSGQPFRIGVIGDALAGLTSRPDVWAAKGTDIVNWFKGGQ